MYIGSSIFYFGHFFLLAVELALCCLKVLSLYIIYTLISMMCGYREVNYVLHTFHITGEGE